METSTTESVYEERLMTLYSALVDVFDHHQSHRIRPPSTMDDAFWDPATARVCAQATRCDQLDALIGNEIERVFPPADYLTFLCPNLLDLPAGIDSRTGWRDDTPLRDVIREVVLQAIDYDVHTRRLFPNSAVWPVHPALTQPS